MIGVTGSWVSDVTRGPDWLFVRLKQPPEEGRSLDLAECLWSLSEQHFVYRVVVELDEAPLLDQKAIDQLCQLRDRIQDRGGVLRLCSVSAANQQRLDRCSQADSFARYENRAAAVRGQGPVKPR